LAIKAAILDAPALVLLVAPTMRQSGELIRKVYVLFGALTRPADQPPDRARGHIPTFLRGRLESP